jgi:hypothetical protein
MSKPEEKISLGRTSGSVVSNFETVLRGTRLESFEWINLAQAREMCWDFAKMVMNIRGSNISLTT